MKQKLKAAAAGLSPAQVLHQLKQILLVEVWFELRNGGRICLPRITQPEEPQKFSSQALSFVYMAWRVTGKGSCNLEAEDTTTIPKFYFTQYGNITGRGSEALSEETPRAERSLFGGFGQLPP